MSRSDEAVGRTTRDATRSTDPFERIEALLDEFGATREADVHAKPDATDDVAAPDPPTSSASESRRTASVFLRLLRYARPYWHLLLLALVLAVLGIVIELARPWAIRIVVDYGLSNQPEPAWLASVRGALPGAESSEGLIVWSVLAVVVMVLIGFALALGVLYLTVDVARRAVFDLSRDMFLRLQRLSIAFHGRSEVGDLMQRASSDVFVAFSIVSQITFPLAVALLTLGGMFAIMLSIDPLLTLVALAVVPALLVAIVVFRGPMDRATSAQYAPVGLVDGDARTDAVRDQGDPGLHA